MIYSEERIKMLSQMAHIALSGEDTERLCRELDAMHKMAQVLQNAPPEAEEEDPFLDAVPLSALRADIPGQTLSTQEFLHSDSASGAYFTVPRAVEEVK